jgi:hypothetical protein
VFYYEVRIEEEHDRHLHFQWVWLLANYL